MNNGWIKLHRKILLNDFSSSPAYLSTWIHLLLKAGHEDKTFFFNGVSFKLKAGQFITGRNKLEKEIGVPHTTLDRILDKFEEWGQIGQQKTNKYRLITILKWKSYQEVGIKRASNGHKQEVKEVEETIVAKATEGKLPVSINKMEEEIVLVDDDGNRIKVGPRGGKRVIREDPFNQEKEVDRLAKAPQGFYAFIGLEIAFKEMKFENHDQFESFKASEVRAAQKLKGYTIDQVLTAMEHVDKKAKDGDFKWNLNTVGKYISEVINK